MAKGNSEKEAFIDSLIPEPLFDYLKDKRYMSIGHVIHQATANPYGDDYMLDFIEVQKEFLKDIKRKPGKKNEETGKVGRASDQGYVSDIYKHFNYDKAIPVPYNLREGFPFVIKGTIWNSYNYPPNKSVEVREAKVLEEKCPATLMLFRHIYRDSLDLALDYATVEFMKPQQKLPVQVLFSKENKTAKSTILNQRKYLYGSNGAIIDSSTFDDKFNEPIVGKNFIGIDEGKLKDEAAMEKIKMRVTADTIQYRAMRQASREVPNFGKWFIATNKEKFAMITPEDSRFWMIQCYKLEHKYDPNFNDKLKAEVPFWAGFLKYRWENRFNKSVSGVFKMKYPKSMDRLWFPEESYTTAILQRLKMFNKTKNCKLILDSLINWFEDWNGVCENLNESPIRMIEATATDINKKFFEKNSNISPSDIKRILEDELDLRPISDNGVVSNMRYNNVLHQIGHEVNPQRPRKRNVFELDYVYLVKMRDGDDVLIDQSGVKSEPKQGEIDYK